MPLAESTVQWMPKYFEKAETKRDDKKKKERHITIYQKKILIVPSQNLILTISIKWWPPNH